ncbi:MAG: hypothetical protein GY806_02650 [Gammaproteobacteria bacterium]|nr:hypothetical protein [Gammaproteobacteria bacterium]
MRLGHRGFQVRHYQPWKLWLGIVSIIAMFFAFFTIGRGYQAYELDRLLLERETLISQISELKTRNINLVEKNAHLGGISKVEHDAYQLANRTLIKHQEEILVLKEELAFYQGIVAPSSSALAVNLQSFEVNQKSAQNLHSYKLVLTKSGKSNRKVKGRFKILLRGETAGTTGEYKLEDVKVDKKSKSDNFDFRYFQIFEGDFVMPAGFEPYEAEIHINPSTKKVKSLTETISWTTVMSEDV